MWFVTRVARSAACPDSHTPPIEVCKRNAIFKPLTRKGLPQWAVLRLQQNAERSADGTTAQEQSSMLNAFAFNRFKTGHFLALLNGAGDFRHR